MPFALFTSISNGAPRRLVKPLSVLLLALAGFAVMGYHPGFEDDGIYLSAVKADLNPALYPHDADFFRLQTQASVFDDFISGFSRVMHISLDWAELLWQFLSLFTILWASHSILQRLFLDPGARWAGLALLAAMFTLPVAGTAINLVDQHLHPRNIATALILFAVDRKLAGRRWQAVCILLLAIAVHPIMAAFGISFCLVLDLVLRDSVYSRVSSLLALRPRLGLSAAFPLSWIFEPPTADWRRALSTRRYYFLSQWTWYEWLGAIGPLVLFWILWRSISAECRTGEAEGLVEGCQRLGPCKTTVLLEVDLQHNGSVKEHALLARFTLALLLYGAFQQCIAIFLLAPDRLVRLTPLQPMRYLHLQYIFLVLIAGGLVGRYVLGHRAWRWAVFLLITNGGMFFSQRLLLPASEHLEFPERTPRNPWLQAFAWIRENTPIDAYFALDPRYLDVPGEDYHSFRALAERSQLADELKDAAVVTQVPELGPRWVAELEAEAGWNRFQIADFQRLKSSLGVDWVLLSNPPPSRLICVWHDDPLWVCRIPAGPDAPFK